MKDLQQRSRDLWLGDNVRNKRFSEQIAGFEVTRRPVGYMLGAIAF